MNEATPTTPDAPMPSLLTDEQADVWADLLIDMHERARAAERAAAEAPGDQHRQDGGPTR